MSEILGDADREPRGKRRFGGDRDSIDDRPAFDDLGYGDDFDDEFSAPGPLRRFVARIATAESLAIASVVIATASWLDLPAVNNSAALLSISHSYTPTYSGRAQATGQIIVALIAVLLAVAGRRRGLRDEPGEHEHPEPAQARLNWASYVSGAALIIGLLSIALAVVEFLIAGTSHEPGADKIATVQGLAALSGALPWLPR